MPKKAFGINPKVEAAREREAVKKESEKQVRYFVFYMNWGIWHQRKPMKSKKKAAEDSLWEDEKNNKFLLRKAEEEKKKQVEAEKRAAIKALQVWTWYLYLLSDD